MAHSFRTKKDVVSSTRAATIFKCFPPHLPSGEGGGHISRRYNSRFFEGEMRQKFIIHILGSGYVQIGYNESGKIPVLPFFFP